MADEPKRPPTPSFQGATPYGLPSWEPPLRIAPAVIVRGASATRPVIDATVDAPFYYPPRAPVAREYVATINPYGDPRVVAVDPTIDYDFAPRKPPTHRPESGKTIDVQPVLSDADEARFNALVAGTQAVWRAAKAVFRK